MRTGVNLNSVPELSFCSEKYNFLLLSQVRFLFLFLLISCLDVIYFEFKWSPIEGNMQQKDPVQFVV